MVGAGNLFTAAVAKVCENDKNNGIQKIITFILFEEKFIFLFINKLTLFSRLNDVNQNQ